MTHNAVPSPATITAPLPADLFRDYQSWAIRHANYVYDRLSSRRAIAVEELENAALWGLWRAANRWSGPHGFPHYAVRYVRGAVLDWLELARRWMTGVKATSSVGQPWPNTLYIDVPIPEVDPHADAVRERVESWLRTLPTIAAKVVRLHCLHGLSQADVGRAVGMPTWRVLRTLMELKLLPSQVGHGWARDPRKTRQVEAACNA